MRVARTAGRVWRPTPAVAVRVAGLVLAPLIAAVGVAAWPALGANHRSDPPIVDEVQPDVAAPGGLLLLTGRNLPRDPEGWLDGAPLGRVTWISAGSVAVEVPDTTAAGTHTLNVRLADGAAFTRVVTVSQGAGTPHRPERPSTMPNMVDTAAPPTGSMTPSAVGMSPGPAPAAGPDSPVMSGAPIAAPRERERPAGGHGEAHGGGNAKDHGKGPKGKGR